MKKKKSLLLILSSVFIASNGYAAAGAAVPVPVPAPAVANPLFANLPPNPVISIGAMQINTTGNRHIVVGNMQFNTPGDLASYLLNHPEANFLKFYYDVNGPRGINFCGKHYPSLAAILKTVKLYPSDDAGNPILSGDNPYSAFNTLLNSLAEEVEKDPRLSLVEASIEKLQAATSSEAIRNLQNTAQNELVRANSTDRALSVLAPESELLSVYTRISDAITNLITSRMSGFLQSPSVVAAGDNNMQSYGVWAQGMFGNAKQKKSSHDLGYKLNQQGANIGFDFGDDNYLVGIAYTRNGSKVKNLSMNEKITSNIGSLYSLYNLDNNFFLNGQLKYGRSTIKKQRSNTNGSIAYGKTKGEMAGAEVELGYYYDFMSKSQLIPTIGLSYDYVKVKGYKETGSGITRAISKRNGDKTSAFAGLMVNHNIDLQSFTLTPEIHTYLDYAIKSKAKGINVTLFTQVQPIYIPSTKPARAYYAIGTSLKLAKEQKLNVSLGYDFGVSKKFYSHSGYIQARVNF